MAPSLLNGLFLFRFNLSLHDRLPHYLMNPNLSLDLAHAAQEGVTEVRLEEAVIKTGALENAIFNSANF